MTFDARKACFGKVAEDGLLQVGIELRSARGTVCGVLHQLRWREKSGEIESIFVGERYRKPGTGNYACGQGTCLARNKWSVRIEVSIGNGTGKSSVFP